MSSAADELPRHPNKNVVGDVYSVGVANPSEQAMTYVRPRPVWLVLLAYLCTGAAVGLALPLLRAVATAQLGYRGFGVALAVNIVMPLLVVALAAAYPRLWIALLGTLVATLGFLICGGQKFPPFGPGWILLTLRSMRPVLVVACVAYHVLACITVLAVRVLRRVGVPPDPRCCATCGYPLVGLTEARCPECSTPFDMNSFLGTSPAKAQPGPPA